ncbi:hypothetical protein [Aureliella helgolandensis]|uniref:Lipoprotein n=1 Tax=Aureliella helgolandensis TaxID=2527968 RepID=A0A518G0C0_9BACT|nr:hypothetical protein [Aureliella helgolandensis]QDV22043.1 hypothetical protein Q31a_03220 [Aureliella helgolandensis]
MKKIAILGIVCLFSSGCGWLPLRRGAPCNTNCATLPPAPAPGCVGCENSAGYGSYDSGLNGSNIYYGNEYPVESFNEGTISPPMSTITPTT